MTEQVTVVVTGLTGSGKSAVAGEIAIALRAVGLTVHIGDQSERNMTGADWVSALEMYRPVVTIVEQNVPRSIIGQPEGN
jgi:predicted kinase